MSDDSVKQPVEVKSFRTLPSFRLHLLSNLSERFAETFYRRTFGLKLLECRVIGITGGYGEVGFKRVCQEANLEKSYASRLVNTLHTKGLIQKLENPADHRSLMLTLTDEGRRVHSALHQAAVEVNERWTSVLTERQRKVFMTCLVLLTEQTREMIEEEKGRVGGESPRREAPPAGKEPAQGPGEVVLDAKTARQVYRMLGTLLGENNKP